MNHLYASWRWKYVSTHAPQPDGTCVFCPVSRAPGPADGLVVAKGETSFVVLNRFPYTSGHVMVIPYRHIWHVHELSASEAQEFYGLIHTAAKIVTDEYAAPGLNIGMNIGAAAGVGIGGHLHCHLLPRWAGDTNFMTTIGETRVLPEDLGQSVARLRPAFAAAGIPVPAASPSSSPNPKEP